MPSIAYGRALYYPYINFPNDRWVKTAALFYEGVDRIVPDNSYLKHDSETVKRLVGEQDFVKSINPQFEAEEIAEEFLEYAKRSLLTAESREKVLSELKGLIPKYKKFSIHMNKLGALLKYELPRLQLILEKKEDEEDDWYEFEPVTGALYMTYLANHLAQIRNIPTVTDDPMFQSLLRGTQIDRYKGMQDTGLLLGAMVIKASLPENIENIPVKKIISFRKNYADERVAFYTEVNNLVKELKDVDRQDTLLDCLHYRKRNIDAAVRKLEKGFKRINSTSTGAILGISIPSFASGHGEAVAVVGVVAVALLKLLAHTSEYSKSRESSPYSYVLALKNNLRSETFAEQLIRGKFVL